MRRTVEFTAAFTLAATLALGGCSDSSSVIQPVDEPTFFTHAPAPGFSVVLRDVPLATAMSATATIGAEGGRIDIDGAGISLVIPAGAVDGPTEITVRARAGEAVAYDFAPRGLEFETPVMLSVRLVGTDAAHKVAGAAPGTILHNTMGVSYERGPDGAAEPIKNLPAERTEGGVTVQLMTLLAGYATASG